MSNNTAPLAPHPGLPPAGGPPPKQAQIGILGLGYVGLPLMLRYAEDSYPVLGFDIDPAKVDQFNAGQRYIEHIPAAAIARARGFSATTDFSRARDCDAQPARRRHPNRRPLPGAPERTAGLRPPLRPGRHPSRPADGPRGHEPAHAPGPDRS